MIPLADKDSVELRFSVGDKVHSQQHGKSGKIKQLRSSGGANEYLVGLYFGGTHWLPESDLSAAGASGAKPAEGAGGAVVNVTKSIVPETFAVHSCADGARARGTAVPLCIQSLL